MNKPYDRKQGLLRELQMNARNSKFVASAAFVRDLRGPYYETRKRFLCPAMLGAGDIVLASKESHKTTISPLRLRAAFLPYADFP